MRKPSNYNEVSEEETVKLNARPLTLSSRKER